MMRYNRISISSIPFLRYIVMGVIVVVVMTGFANAIESPAKHVDAYQAALAEEQTRRKQLKLMAEVSEASVSLVSMAEKYEQNVRSIKSKAIRIHESLSHAAGLQAKLRRSALDAKRAIDNFFTAATTARNAAMAFAAADARRQPQLARQADAAAGRKARARALALEAVTEANKIYNQLHNQLDSLSYKQRQVKQTMTDMSQSATGLWQQVQAFTSMVWDAGGKIPELSLIQVRTADTKGVIGKIHHNQQLVTSRLEVLPNLSHYITRLNQLSLQDPVPTKTYYKAVFNLMIETDAHAFVVKARKASDPDIIEAVRRVNLMKSEARQADKAIKILLESSDSNLKILKPLIETVSVDIQSFDSLVVADTNMLNKSTKRLQTAIDEAYTKTRQAYRKAQLNADKAYMTAYGKPRQRSEDQQEMPVSTTVRSGVRLPDTQASSSSLVITTHAWEFFTAIDGESKNFGAYTYVLFGYRTDTGLSEDVRERYKALLDAILTPTPHRTELPSSIDRKKVNLFCIPGKKTWKELQSPYEGESGKSSLDNYHSSVSFAYLLIAGNGAVVSQEILKHTRNSPGPFLLTTIAPLNKVKTYSPMLFVDLSRFHPDTYREIVTSYKRALVEDPPKEQEQWEPSTLQWVALGGYDVATHLSNVKTAVESWLKAGGDKPVKIAMY